METVAKLVAVFVTDILSVVTPTGTVTVKLVDEAAVTVAFIEPKKTILLAGVLLKPKPLIITDSPALALRGVKEVIEAGGILTVNEVADVTVPPGVVTAIVPVVAPAGIVAVICVAEVAVKVVAAVPLKLTAVTPVKFVPVIVTVAPFAPLEGVKEVMVGAGTTVKLVALVAVPPGVVTAIVPVVAPVGTVAVIVVAFVALKVVAAVPLKLTAVTPVKLVPVSVTVEPIPLLVGVNEVIVGTGNTVMLWVA